MTRDELLTELTIERFAPTGHTEFVDGRLAPVYAAPPVLEENNRPDAQVIRLADRRRPVGPDRLDCSPQRANVGGAG